MFQVEVIKNQISFESFRQEEELAGASFIHRLIILLEAIMTALLKSLTILLALCTAAIEGASFDKPHKHEGLVPPYEPKAPKVDLNKQALSTLNAGKIYKVSFNNLSSFVQKR